MDNHQLFAYSPISSHSGTNLHIVYNTHVYGYYRNNLLLENIDIHCLLITLEGNAKIVLRNSKKTVSLSEKTIFISKLSHVEALVSECEHWHFICYWFFPHNITLPSNRLIELDDMNVEEENAEATKIISLLQTRLENKIHYANAYFFCRISALLEQMTSSTEKKGDSLLDRIILYINTHLEEDIHVSTLSQEFFYCEKYIRQLFKKRFNLTPKQYINKIKLENISSLLLTSSHTLEELADKFGFYSSSHLTHVFKKEYGVSPSEFKKSRKRKS